MLFDRSKIDSKSLEALEFTFHGNTYFAMVCIYFSDFSISDMGSVCVGDARRGGAQAESPPPASRTPIIRVDRFILFPMRLKHYVAVPDS